MIWGDRSASQPNADETDSFPDFYDYRAQSRSFRAMAAYTGAGAVLNGAGEAQELTGVAVNGDFFEAMGMQPMLGRGFTAEESKVGAAERRRPQLRALAARVRQEPEDRWTTNQLLRPQRHRARRDAARMEVPGAGGDE